MKSTVIIPFEVRITDDMRIYGPSGDYVTISNNNLQDSIGRLIKSEIEKQSAALASILSKELNKPLVSKQDKSVKDV